MTSIIPQIDFVKMIPRIRSVPTFDIAVYRENTEALRKIRPGMEGAVDSVLELFPHDAARIELTMRRGNPAPPLRRIMQKIGEFMSNDELRPKLKALNLGVHLDDETKITIINVLGAQFTQKIRVPRRSPRSRNSNSQYTFAAMEDLYERNKSLLDEGYRMDINDSEGSLQETLT